MSAGVNSTTISTFINSRAYREGPEIIFLVTVVDEKHGICQIFPFWYQNHALNDIILLDIQKSKN